VDGLKKVMPQGMTLPQLALRFILSNDDVDVVIPECERRQTFARTWRLERLARSHPRRSTQCAASLGS